MNNLVLKPDTDYLVKGYLFVRLPGPFGLGHTGVGYEVREINGKTGTHTHVFFGSVENGSGWPVVLNAFDNAGWCASSSSGSSHNTVMLSTMRTRGYTNYKFEAGFRKAQPWQLKQAWLVLSQFPWRGYNLQGNNCMNASYEVLSYLGAPGLAWPFTSWFPRDQFNNTTSHWSSSHVL